MPSSPPSLLLPSFQAKEKVKLPPEVQAIKDKLVGKIFSKRRGNKLLDSMHYNTQYLLTTFQQFDNDMSGKLSHDEVRHGVVVVAHADWIPSQRRVTASARTTRSAARSGPRDSTSR